MGWQHTEPGTNSHPAAAIPVHGWHGEEGQQGREQGRESALTSPTAGISLPCGSQSLHWDLNTAFNHSKVTTMNLAQAWRAIILTIWSP